MADVAVLHHQTAGLPGKDQMTCNGIGESDRDKDEFADKSSSKKAWSRSEDGRHSTGSVRKLATLENRLNEHDGMEAQVSDILYQ